MEIKRNILLNPGPATTTDSVKMAQVVPDICPREKEFGQIMAKVVNSITQIAGVDKNHATVLFGGSGTSAVDAALNAIVPDHQKILIVNNGAYGQRMADIARAYRIQFIEVICPWDQAPMLNEIEQQLQNDPNIGAIVMVHHETTTGLLNPVAEVGKIADRYQKLFMVDAVSSFGGLTFSVEDYHIDFMAGTANKCLEAMAGCAFVVCNKSALEQISENPCRSFYLDLYRQYQFFQQNGQMRFTPPVQVIYALHQALQEFQQEGAENRQKRYRKNWQTLITGMKELGFRKLLPDHLESNILTTFHFPNQNFHFQQFHDLLYQRGFTIYPGKISNAATFRLANLGSVNSQDMKDFCTAVAEVLQKMRAGQK